MGWLETMALAAFTAGLIGGVHCAAMCGGILCLLGRHSSASVTSGISVPRRNFILAYNAGRVMSYTLAGVFAGTAGQAGLALRGSAPLQQVFMLGAALSMCLLALYLAGITPLVRSMESAGSVLWRYIQPLARGVLPVDSVAKALGLGMVWGWLPCGMVYAVLLLALSSGNGLQGAIVMLSFGLGTLPNMLLLGGLVRRIHGAMTKRHVRLAAAGVIAGAGIYGMVHAVHPQLAAADGLFCRLAQ
jgi:uncharacterized protein